LIKLRLLYLRLQFQATDLDFSSAGCVVKETHCSLDLIVVKVTFELQEYKQDY